MSLRWRLMLLVAVTVLPLLIFSLGYQYWEYRQNIEATGARTLTLARSMSVLVEEELQARVSALEALATGGSLQEGALDRFRARAETVVRDEFPGSTVELLRADGAEIVNTAVPAGAPVMYRRNLDSLYQVLQTGEPAVSNLFESATDHRSVVAIDVPVKDDEEKVIYVLSLHPQLAAFGELLQRQHWPENWRYGIFDRAGNTIARFPNGELSVGNPASPSLLPLLQAQNEGHTENLSREGVPLVTGFSRGERFGWSVAIGIPRAELMAPVVAGASRTLVVAGGSLAIGLLLAALLAQRIAAPIGSLRRLAATVEGREPVEPTPTGLPEVDEVARALHTAGIARQKSREAELALRNGIDTMSAGFVMYDEHNRLVICNKAYRDFYPETADLLVPGTTFEEILRVGIARNRFPAAIGREEEWIAERLRRQREDTGVIEQPVADGRWVVVTKHRLPTDWVVGLRIDVTALKAAEAALRDSESQLRHAHRIAHMGNWVSELTESGETERIVWSAEAYDIMGVAEDGFDGTPAAFMELVHPDDRQLLRDARDKAIHSGAPVFQFEHRIVRPDGTIRWVHQHGEIQRNAAAMPVQMLGVMQDISERRQTEEQLRQSQKMEAIGNLTGGMAHDFNNLLGVIVGNLGLAREELGDNEDLREMVGEALDAAWRGADLTRRLLAFARRQPLRPAQIDVNELISDAVRLLRRLLGETIDVQLKLGADIWPIVADPAQLESSMANLATNARDAMPNGGQLIIETENRYLDEEYAATHSDVRPGDFVVVEISDTGSGMSQETMSRIFEPFFTTKDQGKGTGLGLSMVFGFLKQSGGHVNVYSELGVGTTFRLYLPRATEDGAMMEAADEAPIARGAGEVVLVVEDNPGMRRVVLRQLRELGYRALECDRAAAALEILQHEAIDLVLTDIVMPGGIDGVELARFARERRPNLKIVLTSGFPQARVERNSDMNIGLRLLSKPYRREELAAALRAALRE